MKLLCIVIDLRHLQVVFLWIQQATMHRLQHCFHDPKQIKSCGFNWYKMCTFQAIKECFRSLTSCQLWTSSSLLFFALWTWTNWHTQRKKKTDTSHMNIIKIKAGKKNLSAFIMALQSFGLIWAVSCCQRCWAEFIRYTFPHQKANSFSLFQILSTDSLLHND